LQIVEVRRNDVTFLSVAPFSDIGRDFERGDDAVDVGFGLQSFGVVGLWQTG